MGTHQAPQHRLQEAFDLLMYPTTCLWWRKYGIITHGINPFLARFFFFCKNYPSFFPPWQPLFLLVGINGFHLHNFSYFAFLTLSERVSPCVGLSFVLEGYP